MKPTNELKAYKDELKENEKTIQILTKKNKHIKDHIKYLEEEIKQQETEVESNEPAVS